MLLQKIGMMGAFT